MPGPRGDGSAPKRKDSHVTTEEIKPLFLSDLVDIARTVYEEQEKHRDVTPRVEPEERFLAHLSYGAHHVDHELWKASRKLVRSGLGAPNTYYLFAFPYPDMVITALALEGRSGDWSNMILDFCDQREVDYPEGTCVPDCSAVPGCGHSHLIIDAYSRAGHLAHGLERVVMAAGALAIESATPPKTETPEEG